MSFPETALPEFRLSSLAALENTVERWRPSHVVSIVDPDAVLPRISDDINHTVLRFHDVARGPSSGPAWIEPPTGGHIKALLDLAATLSVSHRVTVHCHAGVSRSPAAIIILVAAISDSAETAWKVLSALDPNKLTDPNRRMLQLADRALRMRGKLIEPLEEVGQKRHVDAATIW